MTEPDWDDVSITVIPDPCWTPEMEAACRMWLELLEAVAGVPVTDLGA